MILIQARHASGSEAGVTSTDPALAKPAYPRRRHRHKNPPARQHRSSSIEPEASTAIPIATTPASRVAAESTSEAISSGVVAHEPSDPPLDYRHGYDNSRVTAATAPSSDRQIESRLSGVQAVSSSAGSNCTTFCISLSSTSSKAWRAIVRRCTSSAPSTIRNGRTAS